MSQVIQMVTQQRYVPWMGELGWPCPPSEWSPQGGQEERWGGKGSLAKGTGPGEGGSQGQGGASGI